MEIRGQFHAMGAPWGNDLHSSLDRKLGGHQSWASLRGEVLHAHSTDCSGCTFLGHDTMQSCIHLQDYIVSHPRRSQSKKNSLSLMGTEVQSLYWLSSTGLLEIIHIRESFEWGRWKRKQNLSIIPTVHLTLSACVTNACSELHGQKTDKI